ncbi:MAG: hypothetical protein KA773_24455 [Chloroflexi bacterium]|nr:hypothetical protein [Chloroflexota bacterium]
MSDSRAASACNAKVSPNWKPTSRSISIRFPEYVLDTVKTKANEMSVPYQALIKKAVIRAYLPSE